MREAIIRVTENNAVCPKGAAGIYEDVIAAVQEIKEDRVNPNRLFMIPGVLRKGKAAAVRSLNTTALYEEIALLTPTPGTRLR